MVAEAFKSGTPEVDLCKFKVSLVCILGYTERPNLKAKQNSRRNGEKARRRKRRKPQSLQLQGMDVHHRLRPSLRIASRWTSVYSFEMGINNNYLRFTDKDVRNTH